MQLQLKIAGLLLVCLAAWVDANPIDFRTNTLDSDASGDAITGNNALRSRADNDGTSKGKIPFAQFVNCDPNQQDEIEQAWEDVQLLVDKPSQFNLDRRSFLGIGCKGICQAGELETAFWGKDIRSRVDDVKFIRKIFSNVKKLGHSVHADNKIRIACNVDYSKPGRERSTCKGQDHAAFTFNEGTDYKDGTIVLCPGFWPLDSIGDLTDDLDKNPNFRNLPLKRFGRGSALLHEITHLDSISGGGGDHIIDVNLNRDAGGNVLAYGVRRIAKLARKNPELARLNADTYAYYASVLYFDQKYGSIKHDELRGDDGDDDSDAPTKALNIIHENKEDFPNGVRQTKSQANWLFYPVPFGKSSVCQVISASDSIVGLADTSHPASPAAAPVGTYAVDTQDGKCEYKNDGTGNAGTLWCGDKAHGCRYDKDRSKASSCDSLAKEGQWMEVQHVPVVVCEW